MNSSTESIPQIQVMSSTQNKTRRAPRDTGFPEPFNDGPNTTLPHPDADLSPNACISQEDVAPARALSRSHRSFLRRKNRNTLGHGRISSTEEAAYSVFSLAQSPFGENEGVKPLSPSMSSARLSKDGAESITSHRDEETPPTSPDVAEHRSKKGGFLKKLLKD